MLSVQSVNLMNRPSFKGQNSYLEYTEEQYQEQKTKLEKQLDDLNSVIENTTVPKPIRAIGKVASVGIGAGLGFVSLKYGYQGTSKVVNKAFGAIKDFAKKPVVDKVTKDITDAAGTLKEGMVGLSRKAVNALAENKYYNQAMTAVKNGTDKLNSTTVMQKLATVKELSAGKLAEAEKMLVESQTGKFVTGKMQAVTAYLKNLTPGDINKGAENLFAFSGGVTGGITALQEVTSRK